MRSSSAVAPATSALLFGLLFVNCGVAENARVNASVQVCRMNFTTRPNACRDPLNGLGVVAGSPPMRTEMAAVTTRTKNGAILVKEAIDVPAIHDDIRQTVWGQIVVHGKPVVGIVMQTTWRFQGGVRRCSVRTDRWGVASCSEKALEFDAADGDTIPIDMTFHYQHHAYSARSTYVPLSD